MADVGIRQLKQQASEIVRRVREKKETITITYRGRPVAKMVPFEDAKAVAGAVWVAMDELARELEPYLPEDVSAVDVVRGEMDEIAHRVGDLWPPGVSAVEAIDEQRREL